MRFQIIALIACTSALPQGSASPPTNPTICPSGLFANLQCCVSEPLGVSGLDCNSPSDNPTSSTDFKMICARIGKDAKCCVSPIAGQAVLCQNPRSA